MLWNYVQFLTIRSSRAPAVTDSVHFFRWFCSFLMFVFVHDSGTSTHGEEEYFRLITLVECKATITTVNSLMCCVSVRQETFPWLRNNSMQDLTRIAELNGLDISGLEIQETHVITVFTLDSQLAVVKIFRNEIGRAHV